MVKQDVTDTTAFGELRLNTFLVAPLTRDTFTPWSAQTTHTDDQDLMFFMTRSSQTLTYSDGGD
jgi:hypothetical protein